VSGRDSSRRSEARSAEPSSWGLDGERAQLKTRVKVLGLLAAVIVAASLPLIARGGTSALPKFSQKSIKGSWAWSWAGRLVRYPFASIGIATFDGKGKCTMVLKENSGVNGAYDHKSTTCEYKVGKSGFGNAEFNLDGEAGAIVFAVGRGEIRFASPDEGAVAEGVMKRFSRVAVSDLVGRWSFSLDGTVFGEKISGAGVMTFDGAGKCSQKLMYNYGTGPQNVTTESCTYAVDEGGIGSADISYSNGTGGDIFFVMGARAKEIFMLATAEGETIYGTGRKQ
jgi:hypothetical protein